MRRDTLCRPRARVICEGCFNDPDSTRVLKELGTLPQVDEAGAALESEAVDLTGVHFNLTITTWWEAEPREVSLDAILGRERDVREPRTFCLVAEAGGLDAVRGRRFDTHADLLQLCVHAGLTPIDLSRPIPLHPVTIPKPWGREIWFSGIEARGVARAGSAPLPWLRAAAGKLLDGDASAAQAPILLKILAPHADPDFGELYFEAHREKTEVYVVTGVDPVAWPQGAGQIRLGFDEDLLASLGHTRFCSDYLHTARDYKSLRDEADAQFGERRQALGISADAVIDLSTAQSWHAALSADLRADLQTARTRLAAFSASRPLAPGDVVCVQPGTPHALQHGVTVIEFQTPHYERSILSFSQQVVTQSGWDTEEALGFASFDPPAQTRIDLISKTSGCTVERVADFDTFEVQRISLEPGATYDAPHSSYRIAVGLDGEINQGNVDASHGFYLPANRAHAFRNTGDGVARLLLAVPQPDPQA